MSLKRHNTKPKPLHNREELLESIVRDRIFLNSYFKDLAKRESARNALNKSPPIVATTSKAATTIQHRNSYDLFFESACISIKSLPPKLAAEAKSRISQIITEFELRAISEEEAQHEKELRQAAMNKKVKNGPISEESNGIVYEFEPFT